MKCLFVYNPCSGNGKINKYVGYVKKALEERFDTVVIKASSYAGEISEFASKACGEYDYLFFAGGDGSFNEVINGIAQKENRPVLGYLPNGTVNDIGRSLGIPRRNVKKAIDKIIGGNEIMLDVMKVGEKYAEYEICAGALTSCSYKAPRKEKESFGKFAYAFEILRNNLAFKDFNLKITANGKETEVNCEFILFLNSRSIASMPVNTNAVLDDGEIELIAVKQVPKPKWYHKVGAFFHIIHFFAFGYNNSNNVHFYEKIKGAHFSIEAPDDLVWNFDGEEGTKGSIEIDVLKNHIKILVPKKKRKKK